MSSSFDSPDGLNACCGVAVCKDGTARPARHHRDDIARNEIVINSAHRDFVTSKSTPAKHRRYVGKL